jgi:hypothetical protein
MPRYSSYTPRRRFTRKKGEAIQEYEDLSRKASIIERRHKRTGFNKRVDYPQLHHDVMLASHTPVITAVSGDDATVKLPHIIDDLALEIELVLNIMLKS